MTPAAAPCEPEPEDLMTPGSEDRDLAVRVARIEVKVDELTGAVDGLRRELQGPNGRNVRDRLHKLENDSAAAQAAQAALEAARAIHDRTLSNWQKWLIAGLTAIGTTCLFVTTIVVVIQAIH